MTNIRDNRRSQARVAALPRGIAWQTEGLGTVLFAAILGAFIIFGVGFVNAAAVHDVAHDTRHAISFPCH